MSIEKAINAILSRRGYVFRYAETLPSSPEDMYELKVWIEDNKGIPYDFHTIYVHDKVNPKKKAFNKLIDLFIDSYYANINKKDEELLQTGSTAE